MQPRGQNPAGHAARRAGRPDRARLVWQALRLHAAVRGAGAGPGPADDLCRGRQSGQRVLAPRACRLFALCRPRRVESPGGFSPAGAPRTVREPLDSYGSRCSAVSMAERQERLCLLPGLLPSPVGPRPRLNNAAPSVRPHYRAFIPITRCSAPVLRFGTLDLVGAAWSSPLASERQVLTFRTRAWLSFAPPAGCRSGGLQT